MSSSLPYLLIGGGILLLLLVAWMLVRQKRGSDAGSMPPGPVDLNDHVERLGRSIPGTAVASASAGPDLFADRPREAAPASPWRRHPDADDATDGAVETGVDPVPSQQPTFDTGMPVDRTDTVDGGRAETDDQAVTAEPVLGEDQYPATSTETAASWEVAPAVSETESEEPGHSLDPAIEFEEEPVSMTEPEKNVNAAVQAEPVEAFTEYDPAPTGGDPTSMGGPSPAEAGVSEADAGIGEADAGISATKGATSPAPGAIWSTGPQADPDPGPGPEHGVVDDDTATRPAASTWSPWSASVADGPDEERSQRIAAAADWRDEADEPSVPADVAGIEPAEAAGVESSDASVASPVAHEEAAVGAAAVDVATTGLSESERVELSEDVESPSGEWGGPHDDVPSDDAASDADQSMSVPVNERENSPAGQDSATADVLAVHEPESADEPVVPDGSGDLSADGASAGEPADVALDVSSSTAAVEGAADAVVVDDDGGVVEVVDGVGSAEDLEEADDLRVPGDSLGDVDPSARRGWDSATVEGATDSTPSFPAADQPDLEGNIAPDDAVGGDGPRAVEEPMSSVPDVMEHGTDTITEHPADSITEHGVETGTVGLPGARVASADAPEAIDWAVAEGDTADGDTDDLLLEGHDEVDGTDDEIDAGTGPVAVDVSDADDAAGSLADADDAAGAGVPGLARHDDPVVGRAGATTGGSPDHLTTSRAAPVAEAPEHLADDSWEVADESDPADDAVPSTRPSADGATVDGDADQPEMDDARFAIAEGEARTVTDRGDAASETGGEAASETGGEAASGRRVSSLEEVRDGGYSVGSAAPFDDGAQPLGHAVQAYRDSMSFVVPGDAGYDVREPDVWFYDEGAAERAGFRHAGS
ncbi:MAG: hypothetical protein ACRCXL_12800 [Dermatophilaceae bacterium]